jgi:hypothetical protein
MERNLVRSILVNRANASLTILLCFRELCDDGNTEQTLSGELDSLGYGLFFFKLDITDTDRKILARAKPEAVETSYPFERPLTLSLTICASLTGPTFSKKAISSLVLRRAASC